MGACQSPKGHPQEAVSRDGLSSAFHSYSRQFDSAPDNYQIVINGSVRGVGVIAGGKGMAINPGNVLSEIPGEPGKDPAFGLDAVWIEPSEREYAQAVGYTVVDASTVIATHLNSVIKNNADELMTYDVTQQLIDKIAETSPKLIEDFIPEKLSLASSYECCRTCYESAYR